MAGLSDFAADDVPDDRPPLAKPGQLDGPAGEYLTVEIDAEPEVVETDYDDAVRLDATFVESDHDGDFDGEGPFETGAEVRVLTWSKRLVRALQHAEEKAGGSLVGETIKITASGEDMARSYDVALGDG